MFTQLNEILRQKMTKDKQTKLDYSRAYAKLFMTLAISSEQQMNQLLSVNCVFVTAIHRLYGAQFFAIVIQEMFRTFNENHQKIIDNTGKANNDLLNECKTKVKNILNCLLHFYLFQSLSSQFLFDIIKHLLNSFTESDIEILIFVLHNIGLQLRKEDPESIKHILDLFNQKKNSHTAQKKMNGIPDDNEEMKVKEQKMNFLVLELQDIRNNKGNVTLQVRSIEHLQTWLKRDSKLSNELLIKPLDVTIERVKKSLTESGKAWWKHNQDDQAEGENDSEEENWNKHTDWKKESKLANKIEEVAKKHHMVTDVKKAVFQAIVSSEDYLQAFEQLMRLNLKKTQQREIIRVLMHCCINEKSYNPFYELLCQRLIKYDQQNYRYTFKYALWDYIKDTGLDKLEIKQILNLAKLTAFLINHNDIPLHFIKVIDFEAKLSKPMTLFLHLLLQTIIEDLTDNNQIQEVFGKGLKDEKGK